MTCSTAIFSLMLGATALSCAALHFYYKNIVDGFKSKIKNFNTTLSSLQEERISLKSKNDNYNLENIAQTVEIEKLNEEILSLKDALYRLENDNRVLMRAYNTLENQRTVFNVRRAIYNGEGVIDNGQRKVENGQNSTLQL